MSQKKEFGHEEKERSMGRTTEFRKGGEGNSGAVVMGESGWVHNGPLTAQKRKKEGWVFHKMSRERKKALTGEREKGEMWSSRG